jgi:hypothetical protein
VNDINKYTTSQLFNFAHDSYLERTSRPIYAVFFLLPFIIFYELGTILINTDLLNLSQVRVVAFIWLQNSLRYLGFSEKLAWATPALAVVIILLALQITSRKRWSFILADIPPMALECSLLAVPLIVLSLFLNSSAQNLPDKNLLDNSTAAYRIIENRPDTHLQTCSAASDYNSPPSRNTNQAYSQTRSLLASIVTSIGAGIYEELIFRLILICLLMFILQDCFRLDHKNAIILAILISAALFSAHHHIIFLNGRLGQTAPFNWTEFGFRTLAGIYFAGLFAIRGFAITAGTHAFYDIIATLINAAFFSH